MIMLSDQIILDWRATGWDTTTPLYNIIINDIYRLTRAYATKLGKASGRIAEIDDAVQDSIIILSHSIKKWDEKKLSFWKYLNMLVYNRVITAFHQTPYIKRERTCMYNIGDNIDLIDNLNNNQSYPPSFKELEDKEILMKFRKLEKEIIPYLSDNQLLAYSIYVMSICGGTNEEIQCSTMTYKKLDNAIRCTKKILRAYMEGKIMRYSKKYCEGSKFDPRVETLDYNLEIPPTSRYSQKKSKATGIRVSCMIRKVKGEKKHKIKDRVSL